MLGTFRVTVNGEDLPASDLLDGSAIDLGGYLEAGENTSTVHVATLLGNVRYNQTRPYGLVGPVTVTPYRSATIAAVVQNLTKPTISGTPEVGRALTAKPGTWAPQATSYTYAWYVGSKLVATKVGKATLKVKSAYVGKRIRVVVPIHSLVLRFPPRAMMPVAESR